MTRTSKNNGLECLVLPDNNFLKCPKNVVTFGAESVCFFSQPYEFITGNKMYYCIRKNSTDLSIEQCLFLQIAFTNSLKGTEYGYGMGLTGTRFSNRKISLPLSDDKTPNWDYMEQYIINIMKTIEVPELVPIQSTSMDLNSVNWLPVQLGDLFIPRRGNSGPKNKLKPGETVLISARKIDNGFDSMVTPPEKSTIYSDILTVNNNGDGGAGIAYYHPYKFIATQDVTLLIPKFKLSKYSKLFISLAITSQREGMGFGFGNKLNGSRLERLSIMLPVKLDKSPNWQFMEDYVKSISNSRLL
ncbi:hypothetical protein IGJ52_002516 [Enterococcus sp. DIV1758]